MLLKETYELKRGEFQKHNGDMQGIIYVDPVSSTEDPYNIMPVIRDRFDAHFMKNQKVWGWFYNERNRDWLIQNKIKPVLQYISEVEQEHRNPETLLQTLIQKLDNGKAALLSNMNDRDKKEKADKDIEDIKQKIQVYKEELVNQLSSEDFLEKMASLVDFSKYLDFNYSAWNTFLILVQDPQATKVKSAGKWKAYNRIPVEGAQPIYLLVPKGKTPYSAEEKQQMIDRFLKKRGVSSKKELTITDQNKLETMLSGYKPRNFDYVQSFYDVRFTTVIPGQEDKWAQERASMQSEREEQDRLVPWFENGEADERTEMLCNAMISVIEDAGVQFEEVDDLGGARGVSMGGKIEALRGTAHNAGFFSTLVHEFSHELLHQNYLQSQDPDMKNYFVGTREGRGKVEQQAELSAWIVLRVFGYDMKTNINYIGIWGLRQDKAVEVFDSVGNVVSKIISELNKIIKSGMNESVQRIFEITGRQVAQMVGLEQIYDQELQRDQEEAQQEYDSQEEEMPEQPMSYQGQKQPIQVTQNDIEEMVYKSVCQILESKKRKKKDFWEKHGIKEVSPGLGFSEKEQKWYGWSHRAVYGFGVGSKVTKGSCAYNGKEWTAKTLEDAKQMAKDFQKGVD